jgi:hypothetical protein
MGFNLPSYVRAVSVSAHDCLVWGHPDPTSGDRDKRQRTHPGCQRRFAIDPHGRDTSALRSDGSVLAAETGGGKTFRGHAPYTYDCRGPSTSVSPGRERFCEIQGRPIPRHWPRVSLRNRTGA